MVILAFKEFDFRLVNWAFGLELLPSHLLFEESQMIDYPHESDLYPLNLHQTTRKNKKLRTIPKQVQK